MNYKIDKNIPIPTINRRIKYPLNELEINDSFLINIKSMKFRDSKGSISNIRKAVCSVSVVINTLYKKHPEKRFTIRQIDDTHIRCWRTK